MRFDSISLRVPIIYACLLLAGVAIGFGAALHGFQREPIPEARVHTGRFAPLPPAKKKPGVERTHALPTVDVVNPEAMRRLAGRRARVRGKIYRVGHAPKSNTYFLDFGPSRASFTAVVFASAADAFERANLWLPEYEGKEVELLGRIEDDPRYGLEMILEGPGQIRQLDE